jgi:tetratricopeptide (TPR) repeat protein/predicted O-methyltransferase YrrM
MNHSHINQAISACEKALNYQESDRENWQQACRNLGNILQGMGRFDEAIQWHSLALESQPNLGEVYFHIGQLYARQENWQEAIASLKNILQYQPNSTTAYSWLAQIYGHLGYEEAEMDSWYHALMLNPNIANGRGYFKIAQALGNSGKTEAAITCYQRAIERSSGFFAPYYELADIWVKQEKLDQALFCYQEILNQDSKQARAYLQIGKIYLQQNQYQEAIIAFRQAIKINPELPWAYRELVKTFIQLKQWDEAIATCHAIINLVEEYPWVYSHLGNALRQKGDLDAAIAAWQKACVLRGWQQCRRKNYHFSQDSFSYRIPLCQEYLQPLAGQPDIKIVEIGSFEGMSACWLLDKILTHPSAQLTCVEDNFNETLASNIGKTGAQQKVTMLTGNIPELLTSLTPNTYNLIYLQQKAPSLSLLEQNLALVWQLLKIEGLLLFHNCNCANDKQFLSSLKSQWKILAQASQTNQLILQKK